MPTIRVVRHKRPYPPTGPKHLPSLVGKTVKYRIGEGNSAVEVVGLVKSQDGKLLEIAPTVPNHAGVLFVSKERTFFLGADSVENVEVECRENCGVKAFETFDPLEGAKAAQEVREDGIVVDYRDVTFDGYGSTFRNTTPADRDGDYILEGAFDGTLRRFKENPVMLTDHQRSVKNLMGKYTRVGITERGLALTGSVTNSPHPDAVHVRFQLMEKSLKTLSIGGFFYYLEDYRGIEEIELHETSLVVIPANPDANFQVRALSDDVVAKAFSRHLTLNGGELRSKAA